METIMGLVTRKALWYTGAIPDRKYAKRSISMRALKKLMRVKGWIYLTESQLDSSMLDSVYYNKKLGMMVTVFKRGGKDGAIYLYDNIPESTFNAIQDKVVESISEGTSSAGAAFHEFVRKRVSKNDYTPVDASYIPKGSEIDETY